MKFMLLQAYGGVEESVPPMSEWAPAEIEAHIKYQKDLNAELREQGELIEAQALTDLKADWQMVPFATKLEKRDGVLDPESANHLAEGP